MAEPRGIRNNNPGNIEDGEFAASLPGYAGSDGRFAQFETPEDGLHAISKLLDTYHRRGLNTVDQVINRWAPPTENNTNSYAGDVAGQIGVAPNASLDFADPQVKSGLVRAIVLHENGRVPYTAAQFTSAVGGGAQPAATPATTQAGPSDSDLLRMFTKPAAENAPVAATSVPGQAAASPGAPSATPAATAASGPSDADLLKMFTKTAPTVGAAVPVAAPGVPTGNQQPPLMREFSAGAQSFLNGIPIIGPALVSGAQKAGAAANALMGDTPYSGELARVKAADAANVAAHPVISTVGNIAGSIAGTAPLVAAAPAAFGISELPLGYNMAMSGAVGGALGAADSAVRNGGDPTATEVGGLFGMGGGALGPLAGRAIGAGANKLIGMARDYMPASAATQRMLGAINDSGSSVPEIANQLTANPRLAPMDVNPNLQHMAMGLASEPGSSRAIMANAVTQRRASAPGVVEGAFDASLGQTPDVQGFLNELRWKEAGGAPNTMTLNSALNEAMGPSSNPRAVLDNIIEQRAQESAPLYEKALSQPVAWDNRLQEFLDDPVVKSGLAKGVRIQRLESLAAGEPFDPTDYAITDFDAAGDPIVSKVPNMRTLNVVKKGLDAMVGDAKDPVTGRLSEEGRAIDQVRKAFLNKLDDINPDYAAARQAWAGPTKVHAAFAKGLSVFQNRGGMTGVDTTPAALADWMKTASPAEQDALKLGARASIEQQMVSSSDPAKKAANFANLEASRQKLTTILGPQKADALFKSLNAQYSDPVGNAFNKGLDVFSNRRGASGLEDRPEFLQTYLAKASPNEAAALKQGVRVAADQQINAVRNAARKGAAIPEVGFNADKLRIVLGDSEANRLMSTLADEQKIANTNNKLMSGSDTEPRRAARESIAVRGVGPLQRAEAGSIGLAGLAELTGHPFYGGAMLAAGAARKGIQYAGRAADQRRNELLAQWLSSSGQEGAGAMNRLANVAATPSRFVPAVRNGANLLTNVAGQEMGRRRNMLLPVGAQ